MRQRGQDAERDVRVLAQKGTKILARQDGQPGIDAGGGVSGTSVPIEQRHLAEKISLVHFRQGRVVSVGVFHADSHVAVLDQIHGVAGFAAMKQRRARGHFPSREEGAQFLSRFVVERAKERDGSQGIYFHEKQVRAIAGRVICRLSIYPSEIARRAENQRSRVLSRQGQSALVGRASAFAPKDRAARAAPSPRRRGARSSDHGATLGSRLGRHIRY